MHYYKGIKTILCTEGASVRKNQPQESLQTGYSFSPHEKVNNFSSNKILMCTRRYKTVDIKQTCRKLDPTVLLATSLNLKVIDKIFTSNYFKFICTVDETHIRTA